MWKIGDSVEHLIYGKGEVVSYKEEMDLVTVYFELEHEVIVGQAVGESCTYRYA